MNFRNIPQLLLALLFALTCATASAQNEGGDFEKDAKFSNLPKAQRDAFVGHLTKASRLFSEKRIFEVLDEVAKAEAIFADSVALLNLKGSCFVEFRDFERARTIYNEALKLSPESTTVRFNIAEIDFCTKNWQKGHDGFTGLLDDIDKEQVAMQRLIEFKILLCKLQIGQVDEARKLTDKHGFLDDSPYHFFAKGALAFHDDDTAGAEQWLGRAARIFRRPETLAPWQDTLIEYGYIKSFYGGDLEEE